MDDLRKLSKQERRELKRRMRKERRERERREKKRKERNKILKILITIIVLVGVVGFSVNRWLGEAPKIQVTPDRYNFGYVSVAEGTVTTLMTVKNMGKGDLIINNMDSSCGCTSASLIVDGKEGPRFSMSMHGTNPKDWSATLAPGETAQLKIYYDPTVHRELRGPVTRTITVFSNDPTNSEKKIIISANQI